MFNLREIDKMNTYKPNLDDKEESYKRTYGEANQFYKEILLYLNDLGNKVQGYNVKEIYDSCSAAASDLAKCCEMYLKALYIFENKVDSKSVNDIWNTLKNSSFKVDKNGNPIYFLEEDGIEKYIYVKVKENGEKERDIDGKNIYVDDKGKRYSEGKQGKKIKMNGHQLDRLIDILSNDTKLLLEMRMCTIPIENTELYNDISMLDLLKLCGIVVSKTRMHKTEYLNWVLKHKKTFEEARYSGQNVSNVNLEFLFHLATQIKSVAQFKINPTNKQDFNITFNGDLLIKNGVIKIGNILQKLQKNITSTLKYDIAKKVTNIDITSEEFNSMPKELQELFSFDSSLISKELIESLKNKDVLKKISFINMCNEKKELQKINNSTFYNLISNCDLDEIKYLLKLYYSVNDIYYFHNNSNTEDSKYVKNIVDFFNMTAFSFDNIINYSVFIKNKYNLKINDDLFMLFADYMDALKYYYFELDKELSEQANLKYYKL